MSFCNNEILKCGRPGKMHFLALYNSTGNVQCGGEFTAFTGADLFPGSNSEQARA
jgi:hypothetical protein